LKKTAIFFAGFFTCLLCCFLYYQNYVLKDETAVTEETNLSAQGHKAAEESDISIRMNDGMIEWYDGTKWNAYETSDALLMQDPYYLAKDNLEQFEEELVASYRAQSSENGEDTENANEDVEKRWNPLTGTIVSAKSSSDSGNSSKKSSSGSRSSKNSGTSGGSNSNSGTASSGTTTDYSTVAAASGESAATAESGASNDAIAPGNTGSDAGTAASSGDSGSGAQTASSGNSASSGQTASSGGSSSDTGAATPSGGTSSDAGATTPSGGSDTTGGSSQSSGSTSSESSGDGQDTAWTGDYE
jgi:hypothetical protein